MRYADVAPTRKMSAVGIGGAVAVILIWLLETYVLAEPMPPHVAGAVSVICAWGCGWYIRDE